MALFPDEVDVDNVAEAVVGVLKPPVGIPQKVELPAEVIVLVGELLAILAFPENWDFMVLLKGFTPTSIMVKCVMWCPYSLSSEHLASY